ncbi:alpha/beta hydrolase family protein [Pseudomonas sp. dw_358]|uniref:alpha/beta hydrolase family protein n=1 Tax=Pseudomonas sp. dw_358 TaxID=2720083 RepID=UPI001BD6773F|nr:alpha/beta hydrolase family protein [Pseudomonas sp. dw_358]
MPFIDVENITACTIKRALVPALCLSLLCIALPVLAADPAPAAPAAAPDTMAPLPERSQEDALALQRQLPADEQQQLQAGGDNFLALWQPANSGAPEGTVVIVPGAGETADWPNTVGPLRRKMPDANWASLSLTLPDLSGDLPTVAPAEQPAGPVSSDNKSSPPDAGAGVEKATAPGAENGYKPPANDANQDQTKADAERIFARIDAGLAFAQQKGARSIALVGHGTGAYWAARYLNERQGPHVQKLVMIAAKTPTDATQTLVQLLPGLKVPTADIFFNDRNQARVAADQRLQASKRLKDNGYRQVNLTPIIGNSADNEEQVARRVRGFLSPTPQ